MTVREQVLEFHQVFDQPVLEKPSVPDDERVRLRARLITEEFRETLQSLFDGESTWDHQRHIAKEHWQHARAHIEAIINFAKVKVDVVELADGLADLDYVVEGTRLEFGIDGGPVADEVHRSNMAKAPPCPDCDGRGEVRAQLGDGYNFDVINCPTCHGLGRIVRRREDGKILKPDSWTAPDIAGVLRKQGWRE